MTGPAEAPHCASDVDEGQVAAAGVTWSQVEAWAARRGIVFGRGRKVSVAFGVNMLASRACRPPSEVLDEIRALALDSEAQP